MIENADDPNEIVEVTLQARWLLPRAAAEAWLLARRPQINNPVTVASIKGVINMAIGAPGGLQPDLVLFSGLLDEFSELPKR